MSRRARLLASFLLVSSTIACATPRLHLPEGAGTPIPNAAELLSDATLSCANVDTLTAELRISGRAAGRTLRVTVLAGIARPDSVRLEGVAPFGPPVFILVARGGRATLWLPRDNRVVNGPAPEQIIEALTTVSVAPNELAALIAGCGFGLADPSQGRSYPPEWTTVDLANGTRAYLRRTESTWRLAAATRASLMVEYRAFQGSYPRSFRLITSGTSSGATAQSDLTVNVSQLEIGARFQADAFTVKIPTDAVSLTLDELRQSGPLAAGRHGDGR